jgi:hypothetical protein
MERCIQLLVDAISKQPYAEIRTTEVKWNGLGTKFPNDSIQVTFNTTGATWWETFHSVELSPVDGVSTWSDVTILVDFDCVKWQPRNIDNQELSSTSNLNEDWPSKNEIRAYIVGSCSSDMAKRIRDLAARDKDFSDCVLLEQLDVQWEDDKGD